MGGSARASTAVGAIRNLPVNEWCVLSVQRRTPYSEDHGHRPSDFRDAHSAKSPLEIFSAVRRHASSMSASRSDNPIRQTPATDLDAAQSPAGHGHNVVSTSLHPSPKNSRRCWLLLTSPDAAPGTSSRPRPPPGSLAALPPLIPALDVESLHILPAPRMTRCLGVRSVKHQAGMPLLRSRHEEDFLSPLWCSGYVVTSYFTPGSVDSLLLVLLFDPPPAVRLSRRGVGRVGEEIR